MLDPKTLGSVPKQFIDSAIAGNNKEIFMFVFSSGELMLGFATSPVLMKAIAEMFNKNIAMYEEKFGNISMSEVHNLIPSPIQFNNLDGK